jgi:hypothetical protein
LEDFQIREATDGSSIGWSNSFSHRGCFLFVF